MRPSRRSVGAVLLLGALVMLPSQRAHSQVTCTGDCTTPAFQIPLLNVPTLSTVSMGSSSSFALIASGGITATDVAAGFDNVASPLTLTVKTNSAITLKMHATSTTFSGSGCGLTLSDVTYGTSSGGARSTTISSSSSSPNTLLTRTTATSSSGTTVSLYFRVALSWASDPPSTSCALPLTFSLTP